jgi:hypothetical protein
MSDNDLGYDPHDRTRQAIEHARARLSRAPEPSGYMPGPHGPWYAGLDEGQQRAFDALFSANMADWPRGMYDEVRAKIEGWNTGICGEIWAEAIGWWVVMHYSPAFDAWTEAHSPGTDQEQ